MSTKVETALEVLQKQLNQPLVAALEVCARCGICTEACHYYQAEPIEAHMPSMRAEQLRQVYRSGHDWLAGSSRPGQMPVRLPKKNWPPWPRWLSPAAACAPGARSTVRWVSIHP